MSLKEKFIPDLFVPSVLKIRPEFFIENGIDCLICDIDNTLATYGEKLPQKDMLDWLNAVEATGVRIGLISNNSESRVYTFNTVLGYITVSRAMKPAKKKLLALIEQMDRKKENACLIGDQIFTDVLCAKRAGIKAVLVRSIDTRGKPFLRFKKHFESYFMEEYYKNHPRY